MAAKEIILSQLTVPGCEHTAGKRKSDERKTIIDRLSLPIEMDLLTETQEM